MMYKGKNVEWDIKNVKLTFEFLDCGGRALGDANCIENSGQR